MVTKFQKTLQFETEFLLLIFCDEKKFHGVTRSCLWAVESGSTSHDDETTHDAGGDFSMLIFWATRACNASAIWKLSCSKAPPSRAAEQKGAALKESMVEDCVLQVGSAKEWGCLSHLDV